MNREVEKRLERLEGLTAEPVPFAKVERVILPSIVVDAPAPPPPPQPKRYGPITRLEIQPVERRWPEGYLHD